MRVCDSRRARCTNSHLRDLDDPLVQATSSSFTVVVGCIASGDAARATREVLAGCIPTGWWRRRRCPSAVLVKMVQSRAIFKKGKNKMAGVCADGIISRDITQVNQRVPHRAYIHGAFTRCLMPIDRRCLRCAQLHRNMMSTFFSRSLHLPVTLCYILHKLSPHCCLIRYGCPIVMSPHATHGYFAPVYCIVLLLQWDIP